MLFEFLFIARCWYDSSGGIYMKVILGGVLLLAVAMGIGRFSYTPLLPFMQAELHLSNRTAGFIALSNYLGYFIGSLLCTFIMLKNKRFALLAMILISMLSILILGIIDNIWVIFMARFVSGVTSAVIFIFTTQMILTYIQTIQKTHFAGYLYSGVGVGIVGSSILILLFSPRLHLEGLWVLLAVMSLVIGIIGLYLIRDIPIMPVQPRTKGKNTVILYWLYFSYFLEGLGYIITGTFIVNVAKSTPTIQFDSSLIWLIVGVAAIPSCMLFIRLAEKFGYASMLTLALVLQAIGIALPAFSITNWSFFLSAFLFGFTFMGITALTNAIVKQINVSAIGILTALYALGQIIGPAIAGFLLDSTHFSIAFIFASVAVLLASLLVVIYSIFERKCILHV